MDKGKDKNMEKMDKFPEISEKKKKAMLNAYANCGTVTHAADAAGISDRMHRYWLDENSDQYDPDYEKAFERAEKMSLDLLVKAARKRAVEGVREPVYYQGECVGHKLRYSDTLLMFLAKSIDPEKFAEHKKVEQETTEKKNVTISLVPPNKEDYIDYTDDDNE